MPKIKSYEKESSNESYLLVSVIWGIVLTVVTVFLMGILLL